MIPIAKPLIGEAEKKLVDEVLDSGMLAQGPRVKVLEEKFAALCRTTCAVAVNSGTAGLHAALYAAGIKPGDEVITTPFTFVATANSILMQGARPVFADIDKDTFNISPEAVEKKITPKTKAILAVDLYGQIYDYQAINRIAKKHGLMVIEDACQAVDAEQGGKMAGSIADIGVFSLYPTKNITSGEGGMITTNNSEYAERAKQFRHHGQSENAQYQYHDLGYNYRMSDLHAAIALAQLTRLEDFTKKRISNAKLLTAGLAGIPGIITPALVPGTKHVFHQYTIRVSGFRKTRDELVALLRNAGIGCGIYYPQPLHLFPMFKAMGYKPGDFPVAEKAAQEVLSLPVHPSVTEQDIKYIIKTIKSIGDEDA
jgi:perosamine synthetase